MLFILSFMIMYLNAKDDQYHRNMRHGLTRPIKFVVFDSSMYVNFTVFFTLSELIQQRQNYSICRYLLIHSKIPCFTSVRQAYF
jgi:hypothetical protein